MAQPGPQIPLAEILREEIRLGVILYGIKEKGTLSSWKWEISLKCGWMSFLFVNGMECEKEEETITLKIFIDI